MSTINATEQVKVIRDNPFAMASLLRYRYQVPNRGNLNTDDLWDLKLEELNTIYQDLDAQTQQPGQGRSLMDRPEVDPEVENKKTIVEAIFNYKQASIMLAEAKKNQKEYLQRVAGVLDAKRNQALENMSVEELEAILKNGGPVSSATDEDSGEE